MSFVWEPTRLKRYRDVSKQLTAIWQKSVLPQASLQKSINSQKNSLDMKKSLDFCVEVCRFA